MSNSAAHSVDAQALVLAYLAKGSEALVPPAATASADEVRKYLLAAHDLLHLKALPRAAKAKKAADSDPGSASDDGSPAKRRRSLGPADDADEVLKRTVQLLLVPDPAVDRACQLIAEHRFGHEHVGDSQLLAHPKVWLGIFDGGGLPMTALLRNLGRLSALGVMEVREAEIAARFTSVAAVQAARLHPISILEAMRVYASGRGDKGSLTWTPSRRVLKALEEAFYLAFKNVEPTGKRFLLGIDVSGSMDGSKVCGMQSLCAREAAAAILMALMRTEQLPEVATADGAGGAAAGGARRVTPMAFSSGFQVLKVNAGMSLEEVTHVMSCLSFDSTDCAQPMLYAIERRIPVDVFVVLTDNETFHGRVHPTKALERYRMEMGMPEAKLAVLAFSTTEFSIADPEDPLMMDIAGLDSAVPRILRDFAMGAL